jgi:hypothetical protein
MSIKKRIVVDIPTCASCAFFSIEPKDDLGFCRRYPPSLIQVDGDFDSCFPVSEPHDWCGEFTRKVN